MKAETAVLSPVRPWQRKVARPSADDPGRVLQFDHPWIPKPNSIGKVRTIQIRRAPFGSVGQGRFLSPPARTQDLKGPHTRDHRGGNRAACTFAVAAAFAALLPAAAQAEDKKFLIGVVELQLANPFFGKLKKAAVDAAKKNGLEVMTAEAKTAGDSATQIAAVET